TGLARVSQGTHVNIAADGCLNVRAIPAVSGESRCLNDGTELEITGGPVGWDGNIWWPVWPTALRKPTLSDKSAAMASGNPDFFIVSNAVWASETFLAFPLGAKPANPAPPGRLDPPWPVTAP